jgi:hypothetical protein
MSCFVEGTASNAPACLISVNTVVKSYTLCSRSYVGAAVTAGERSCLVQRESEIGGCKYPSTQEVRNATRRRRGV